MQPQVDFLRREFFSMSLQAATQHVKVYATEATEADRQEVRDHLREHLERLETQYRAPVTEVAHVENIERICRSLSRRHAGLLHENRFPFATAQKALNLYLKYLWCLGLIDRPPHCPVDAIVLKAAKAKITKAWTKIESKAQYLQAIAELKTGANGLPLAEWELHVYNASDA
jgi:hypothetical protein